MKSRSSHTEREIPVQRRRRGIFVETWRKKISSSVGVKYAAPKELFHWLRMNYKDVAPTALAICFRKN